MIHLNASDERGIDIIRNQINSFVNSNSLFNDGMKFVILCYFSIYLHFFVTFFVTYCFCVNTVNRKCLKSAE